MDRQNIERLLEYLGSYAPAGYGGWVKAPCPMAPWLHQGGKDHNPSFGIQVNEVGVSKFHCFTCNQSGPDLIELVMLVRELNRDAPTGDINIKQAIKMAEADGDDEEYELPDFEDQIKNKFNHYKTQPFLEFPEDWLESFLRCPTDYYYLKARGITPSVAKALDIRIDHRQGRICFPFRRFDGKLAGLQGRLIDTLPSGKKKPGVGDMLRYFQYGYHNHRNSHIWMGEHTVDFDNPVILVEGPVDYAKVFPLYENVLASFTTGLSNQKLKRIGDASHIVTFYDFGTGGDTARKEIDKMYGETHTVTHIIPPEGEDPGSLSFEAVAELIDGIV